MVDSEDSSYSPQRNTSIDKEFISFAFITFVFVDYGQAETLLKTITCSLYKFVLFSLSSLPDGI